jgi:tetratricopeptide (TPR) repeat protein
MHQGQLKKALANCQEALAVFKQMHDVKQITIASWRLGMVQRAMGQPDNAIASFRYSSDVSEKAHDLVIQPRSLMEWGDVLDNLGKQKQARALYKKALAVSEDSEDAEAHIEIRYRLARSSFEIGQIEDAEDELKMTLDDIEAKRSAVANANLQASYFAAVRKCYDLYVELLMGEYKRDRAFSTSGRALEISESARALTLLDTLSAHGDKLSVRRKFEAPKNMIQLRMDVERAYDQRLKLMLEGSSRREMDANADALTQAIDILERAEDEQSAATATATPGRRLSAAEMLVASRTLHSTLIE